LKATLERETWNKANEEEFEDSEGNVFNKKVSYKFKNNSKANPISVCHNTCIESAKTNVTPESEAIVPETRQRTIVVGLISGLSGC
jgi:hypothetical protein